MKAEASASAAQARILEEARKAQSETQAQPHAAAQVVAAPATPAEPPRQVHVARPPPPPEPEVPVTARSFYPEVAASLKMALVNGAHSVVVVVAGPGEEAEQSGVTWGTVEDNETLEKHCTFSCETRQLFVAGVQRPLHGYQKHKNIPLPPPHIVSVGVL